MTTTEHLLSYGDRVLDILDHIIHSHFDKILVGGMFTFMVGIVCIMIATIGSFSEASVQWARELTIGLSSLLAGLVSGIAYQKLRGNESKVVTTETTKETEQ